MNCISNNIKTLRKHFNLTQTELAAKIDTKRDNITSWEIGRAEPDVKNLQLLCEFFKVPIEDFIMVEMDAEYLQQLREQRATYAGEVNTMDDMVRFLQEELKEKNEIIKSLLKIVNDEKDPDSSGPDAAHGTGTGRYKTPRKRR